MKKETNNKPTIWKELEELRVLLYADQPTEDEVDRKFSELKSFFRTKLQEILEGLEVEDFKPTDRRRNIYHEDRIKYFNQANSLWREKIREIKKREGI